MFVDVAFAKKQQMNNQNQPTRIRSDVIDIKRKSQNVDFIGNVVVEKGDSSLLAQKMKVIYKEKNGKNDGEIKKIEAFDDVKIFSEDFIASGEYGFYDPANSFFTLERKVIVNNGTSIASGDKFVYNIKTKKGNFIGKQNRTSIAGNGGDKRVVVVIGSDAKEIKK